MRELLREQARYITTSQLWEVFNAAIINEAADLALVQSTSFDDVAFAKALHHWGHVFRNAMFMLMKESNPQAQPLTRKRFEP